MCGHVAPSWESLASSGHGLRGTDWFFSQGPALTFPLRQTLVPVIQLVVTGEDRLAWLFSLGCLSAHPKTALLLLLLRARITHGVVHTVWCRTVTCGFNPVPSAFMPLEIPLEPLNSLSCFPSVAVYIALYVAVHIYAFSPCIFLAFLGFVVYTHARVTFSFITFTVNNLYFLRPVYM